MRRLLLAVCCLGLVLAAAPAVAEDPPGAYVAPSPEPTPAETLMLEYINRARANPHGEIERCLDWDRVPDDVDREMFATEMQGFPASPPIFFDLDLLKAARWHSYYMGFNEMDHDEIEGATGFTAVSAHARMRLAGFSAGGTGENIIKYGRNPWHQHVAFVIDWGEGPGNMQPGRGHRANIMSSAYRVVGVGAVEHPDGDDMAVTADFGGGNQRYVGGVVYNDADGDRFYDIDEGVGGVGFTHGDRSVQSWGSGAYTLPISNDEGWVYISVNGAVYARFVPAGTTNLKLDLRVNEGGQFVDGNELLDELEGLNDIRKFKRIIELAMQLPTVFIRSDEGEAEDLYRLVKEVRDEVIADQEELFWAVQYAEIDPVLNLCREKTGRYRGTLLEDWFNDADLCARMRASYLEIATMLTEGETPPTQAQYNRLLRVMERQFEQISTQQWHGYAQKVGEAFVTLGQEGTIDIGITSQVDIATRENFAGVTGLLDDQPAGAPGEGGPLWMTAPLQQAVPQDDTEYEESPFSLE